jgi:hypothetical protein
MGRVNTFYQRVTCERCGTISDIGFQGHIGRLEWMDLRLGDQVFEREGESRKVPMGPDPDVIGRDFWAHALGACPQCNAEMYARVEVRENKVHDIRVVPLPPGRDGYSFLLEWGFRD